MLSVLDALLGYREARVQKFLLDIRKCHKECDLYYNCQWAELLGNTE